MNLHDDLLDVRAVAFDVDGTLAGGDHRVSPRTLRALAELRAAGVEPIIVTGRIVGSGTAIFADAGIDGYVVASNGAVAVDTRDPDPLHAAVMDPDEAQAVVAFCDGRAVEPSLFTVDTMVVEEGSVVHDLLVRADPTAPTRAVAPGELPFAEATKACIFGEPATLDSLDAVIRAQFPRMVRSMDTAFEMSAEGADKWVALSAILDRIGVPPERCAGIGDGENDVVWLSRVGFPVAMGNAREPVRRLARLRIGHHADEAVAELVEALLRARAAR